MEGLLILIGIWVLDIVIKKVAANKKAEQQRKLDEQRQQSMPQYQQDDGEEFDDSEEGDFAEPEGKTPRSLQDLIRQFEEAQTQAAQGNIEPPVPPAPPSPPARRPQRDPNEPLTFKDIAEVVIDLDVVDVEFLVDEFDLSEGTAITVLNDLQKHRIVGRDMGTGECDVLVHDLDELDNLLNREKRAERLPETEEESEAPDARQQELERQRELNALEERAKSARETAHSSSDMDYTGEPDEGEKPAKRRAPAVSTQNIADVRKGFIWAKVLDEPRFKRRWSSQYR